MKNCNFNDARVNMCDENDKFMTFIVKDRRFLKKKIVLVGENRLTVCVFRSIRHVQRLNLFKQKKLMNEMLE